MSGKRKGYNISTEYTHTVYIFDNFPCTVNMIFMTLTWYFV